MLTELRPNKELLDPHFNGYKLSLDPIPVYCQIIPEGADHVTQSEDQYSFIHTKVFSLHNHLFIDPWYDNTVYFIDKTWRVCKATISPETGRVEEELKTVWTIPHLAQRKSGHFNTSLVFPGPTTAVLADGCGQLHVLDRKNVIQWQPELSSEVVGADTGSLLISARLDSDSSLHCVLMCLETVNTEVVSNASPTRSDKPRLPTINTVLHWITLTKDSGGVWSVSCSRRLEGGGSVDYVALEVCCTALYIVSNTHFRFTADSANPLPPPDEKVDSESEGQKPLYTWEQTEDDLKVMVEVGLEVKRDDIEVVVREQELTIQCQQQMIVTGLLSHAVDTELTIWTLQPDKLEITMSKREPGLMWTVLVSGDTRGQQVLNAEVVESVQARLGHLCSDSEVRESGEGVAPTFNLDQLEECDTAPEDCGTLDRLDPTTHTVSHQISLTGHQWLMSVAQGPGSAPCVCVRHDVDGCMWQLDPPLPLHAKDWPCQHVGTFCALGYVAASKKQKKFILASPDLSYSVICEASSHVFVYRKASIVNGELRNRKTSAKIPTVAKQQLINLESQSAVLGASASNSHLFVLTSDMLYTFHIQ